MSRPISYVRLGEHFDDLIHRLSPEALQYTLKLAHWSAHWGLAGYFSQSLLDTFCRFTKPKRQRIQGELLANRYRWEKPVLVPDGEGFRLNPEVICFGRDGSGWDSSETDKVLRRDGCQCRYCGTYLCREEITFDHIYPRSRGGNDKPDNLAVCCVSCNSKKSARTPYEAGMRLRPVPSNPMEPAIE